MFDCHLCSRSFKNRTLLSFHTNSHTKERPYKCTTCSATFAVPAHLKNHIKVVHDGVKIELKKKLKCAECFYKCSAKSTLANHMRKHSPESPFSCSVPGCSFKSKHKGSVPRHLIEVHGQERPYACQADGCNYKGKGRNALKKHLKTHSKEKAFKCSFNGCRFTCKIKDGLKIHAFKVHSEEKPLKCSTCDFRTKYKLKLRQHEDEHRNIKRFHCQAQNCSFASHYSRSVQLHFGSQHKKKDFPCTVPGCNGKYGSVLLLKDHMKKHMRPTLKCRAGDSCNFSTKFPYILRNHVASQHADNESLLLAPGQADLQLTQTAVSTINSCPYPNCNYQTEFPHRYDRHIITHDERKRKHACKFCSRRFKQADALKKHIQRHTMEKPYSCSLCSYCAIDSINLRSHARNTHRIYMVPERGETTDLQRCRLCVASCSSDSESALHSMKHLQPVVLLERLHLRVL